jgi:fructokinase
VSYIVSIGEVLWDSMPSGLFLGGAAVNVAYQLNALGRKTYVVSRVGKDFLGGEVLSRLGRLGIPADGVGVSETLPTGFVRVKVDASGIPAFDIVEPVAWDEIELADGAPSLLEQAAGVIYGTLAQRSRVSRAAIRRAWEIPGFKCCDVNLRPPHDDSRITLESLEAADIVKLNHEELARIATWAGLAGTSERERMESLAASFGVTTLCVTRGPRGAALIHGGQYHEHGGYEVEVVDTVGSGDAFLAGLLDRKLAGDDPAAWLPWANLCGAFVASRAGGTPAMDRAALEALRARG